MFRRTLPGVSILSVCLCSIGLQLPTHVGTGSYFGVFGAEVLPILDPTCNAVAPKKRNCTDLGKNCKNIDYIAGPQSADPGGVNTLRFDKDGTWLECANPEGGGSVPPCIKVQPYQDKGQCTPASVTLE